MNDFLFLYLVFLVPAGIISAVILTDQFDFENAEALFCAPFAAALWPISALVLVCIGVLMFAITFYEGGISIIGRISDWYYERKQAKLEEDQRIIAQAKVILRKKT